MSYKFEIQYNTIQKRLYYINKKKLKLSGLIDQSSLLLIFVLFIGETI